MECGRNCDHLIDLETSVSNRLHQTSSSADVEIINATTAAFPPTSYGLVPAGWQNVEPGAPPEFDLDLIAAGAASVTAVKLYGATRETGVIADAVFTSTHGTDTLNIAAHGLLTGDGPVRVSSSGTLPAGLVAGTDYWIIRTAAGTLKLALSLSDALAGTAVETTSDGTGTHTLSDVAETKLVRWRRMGEIEAALTLASIREGITVRCKHNPRVFAYGLIWTGTAANAIRGSFSPVIER